MKKIFFLFLLIFFFSIDTYSQYVHKIKADSVLITNDSCNAELNLENSTKNVNGFLYNKGKGRTEFRKGLIKIDDTLYIIGNDTLNIAKGMAFGNYIKNQNTTAQTANAWIGGNYKADGSLQEFGTTVLNGASVALGTYGNVSGNANAFVGGYGGSTFLGNNIYYKNSIWNFPYTSAKTSMVLLQSGVMSFWTSDVNGSQGSERMRVNSNGQVGIGVSTIPSTAKLLVQNIDANGIYFGGSFSAASGSTLYKGLEIVPTYNQTGTASGSIYGLYYNPTVTSVLGTHYFLYANTGNNLLNGTSGSTVLGSSFVNTASKLTIDPFSAAGGYLMSITGVTIQRGALNMDMTNWFPTAPSVINIKGTNNYIGGSGLPLVNIDVTQGNNAYAVVGYSSKIYRTAATNAAYITTGYKADVDGYGGNTYGFYSKAVTSATSPNGKAYAFYGEAGLNYFADKVLIGSTIDNGTAKLQVSGNTFLDGNLVVSNTTNYAGAAVNGKLQVVTSGLQSVSIGNVFTNSGIGTNNVYLGHGSGRYLNSSSNYNIALGTSTLGNGAIRAIDGNTAIGFNTLQFVTTDRNIGIGYYTSAKLTSGTGITIGALTGNDIETGTDNIAIGRSTLTASETDSNNWGTIQHSNVIAIGHNINSGSSLGYTNSSYYSTINPPTLTNTIIIGNNIGTNKSNAIILGKANQSTYIPSLDTDLTPPATTGTTKMVIADNEGKLSFTDNPSPINYTVQSLTDETTITWDIANGINGDITLGGNRTLSFSNLASVTGRTLTLVVKQDATGSRTLTLPPSCKVVNGGGGALTLTTSANAVDIISFYIHSASTVYVSYGKNYN